MIYCSPNVNPRQHLRGIDSAIHELRTSLMECALYDINLQNFNEYPEAMKMLHDASCLVARLRGFASADNFSVLSADMPCMDKIIKRL